MRKLFYVGFLTAALVPWTWRSVQSQAQSTDGHVTVMTNSPFTRRLLTNLPAIGNFLTNRLGTNVSGIFTNRFGSNIFSILTNGVGTSAPPALSSEASNNMIPVFPGTNNVPPEVIGGGTVAAPSPGQLSSFGTNLAPARPAPPPAASVPAPTTAGPSTPVPLRPPSPPAPPSGSVAPPRVGP